MAMKKIILTLFITLASLGVLANNFLPVSAPALFSEPSDAEQARAPLSVQNRTEITNVVPPSADQMRQPESAPQIPVTSNASDPAVVTTAAEAAPVTEAEPVSAPAPEIGNAEPEASSFLVASGHVFVSEWIDLPLSVVKQIDVWHTSPKTAENQNSALLANDSHAIETERVASGHPIAKQTHVTMSLQTPLPSLGQIRFRPVLEAPVMPKFVVWESVSNSSYTFLPSFDQISSRPFLEAPVMPEIVAPAIVAISSSQTFLPSLDQISSRPFLEAPVMPEIVAPAIVAISSSQTFLPSLDQIRSRPLLEAPVMPKFVTWESSAISSPMPLPSFDQIRSRPLLEAPGMPKFVAPEIVAMSPQTFLPSLDQIRSRPLLEAPVMPKFVAWESVSSSSQISLPSFDQIRSRPLLEAPVMPKQIAPESILSLAQISMPSIDQIRFRSFSEAPVMPKLIAPEIIAMSPPAPPSFDQIRSRSLFEAPIMPKFIAWESVSSLSQVSLPGFDQIRSRPLPGAPVMPKFIVPGNTAASLPPAPALLPVAEKLASTSPASPTLITDHFAFSSDILKPLVTAPQPSETLFAASLNTTVGGLGDSSSPGKDDKTLAAMYLASQKNVASAVLVNGKTEFAADLLKPMNADQPNSTRPLFLRDPSTVKVDSGYCDPNFVGQPIRFSQTAELRLDDLLSQLHNRFGVNFIMGPTIRDLPLYIKAGSIPWNVLLRSQLFISGVRARCIDSNTIELVQNSVLPTLQDQADVKTKFIKLKFLQRTSSGSVDLAGRSQGGGQNGGSEGGCGGSGGGGQTGGGQGGGSGGGQGGGQQGETASQQGNNKFDKLIAEIEKILGIRSMTQSSGGGGGQVGGQQTEERRTNRSVTQIPGRNILVIKATDEEFALIDQILARADRPPFQVVIKGLVYTANQTRLRDIGVQTTITGGTADGRTTGGLFGHTLGTGTLFDFSTIIGTFDFNVQATAFQQNGIISIKSRPFATVLDGLCTTLDVGPSLPVVIDSTLGGQGNITFVNAANNLSVTPYVLDDDAGNPMAVTLDLRITANTIDNTTVTRGVPAISQRSIQTQLLLGEDKTAILGGFTVDQDRRDLSKTPGLGDIPIIGELFKRRIRDTQLNRLYFAISVSVVPYGEVIRPVDVPGATTDPPSITPLMKKRAEDAEPKQVVGPGIPPKITDH
jgi:hypothetical protein